jgi:hypothetical protein
MIWSEEAEIERLVVTNKISVINLTPTLPEELTSKSYVDSQVGSSVKLDSVNTFTANQNISGDLKANNVVVLNTTTTLNTQLTSKLYVDTALNGKQDKLSAGTGITIVGNTISSQGSVSAGSNIQIEGNVVSTTSDLATSRMDVSDKVVITNTDPTMYSKNTNNRSGMIHLNSDRMYFLSGVANSETWTQINSQWALYLQLDTNQAVFGGNITLNTGNIQSSKFRVTQAVTNVTNVFPSNTTPAEVTIANNVGCGGGTIVFHISCGARAILSGLHTLTFRYKNGQGTTRATITASFYFNQ